MENMPLKEKKMDDLDYLAQLGFDQGTAGEEDVEELTQRIRSRAFSYSSGTYFALTCLLTGIFLGASLFFVIYEAPPEHLAAPPAPVMNELLPRPEVQPALVQLDTVTVEKENFVSAAAPATFKENGLESTASYQDSTAEVLSGHMNASALLEQPLKEEKLRYIANAPVFYIHDLKVTDYRALYFKKNHFVSRNGTAAASAAKEGSVEGIVHLKENADYFLHEELADALLNFKKGKYDRCLYSLTQVASYNKEDVNCDFYMGMCYYYKKNYAKAIGLLDKCAGNLNNTFLQEATYYKALSLYESGNKIAAQELFKQIAEEGEFYATKAGDYLK